MKRIALSLSIGIILAYWLYSAGIALFRSGEPFAPAGVGQLALFVCVKTAVVVGVIVPLLRMNGERLTDLGFDLRALRLACFRGCLLGVGIFLIAHVLVNSLLAAVGVGGTGTSSSVRALFHDPREAPLWVFCAIVGGGFSEELVRAFILNRFEQAFGTWGLALAVVVDCVEFGAGHLYQGATSAVTAGLSAVLFALVYLHRRRVADAMVAHAAFDLLGVAAAYALYGRGA
jgi:membrane protease YdiL (CAAX protease family)